MSNYHGLARHPQTGKPRVAYFLDGYFGKHKYGVRFVGEETVFPIESVEKVTVGEVAGPIKKPHLSCGREGDAYVIHIDGVLRGRYNSPEMMQVHLADQIAENDRLRSLCSDELVRESERLGLYEDKQ